MQDEIKPRYIKVQLSDEMLEKLETYKVISGSSYSNTIRMALMEYLNAHILREIELRDKYKKLDREDE